MRIIEELFITLNIVIIIIIYHVYTSYLQLHTWNQLCLRV